MKKTEIDKHPLLDDEQKKMCRIFAQTAARKKEAFTMLQFAEVALRATGNDYADARDGEIHEQARTDLEHRRAAVLYVREALISCEHEIITQWPEFDTMLQQLDDLVTLGLP